MKGKKIKGGMPTMMAKCLNDMQTLLKAINGNPETCQNTEWADCSVCLKHNKCEREKGLAQAAGFNRTKDIWDYMDSLPEDE